MFKFKITIAGALSYETIAATATDALIEAREHYPNARNIAAVQVFDIGTELVERSTGLIFRVTETVAGWVTYKGDAGIRTSPASTLSKMYMSRGVV